MDRVLAAAKVQEGTSDGDFRFLSLRFADQLSAYDQPEAAGVVLAYVERKDLDGAQAALDRTGIHSSDISTAAIKLAMAWLDAGQSGKARDVGVKAHAARDIELLIRALYNRGHIAEANAVLEACRGYNQIGELTLYAEAQAIAVSGKPDAAREVLARTAQFNSPESARELDPLIAALWAHKDAAGAAKWAADLKIDVRAQALAAVVAAALEELDPSRSKPADASFGRPPNPFTR
jgi:hypothetical protein